MSEFKEKEIEIDAFTPYLRAYDRAPIHRIVRKFNRNQKCPYTDLKFKRCCGKDGKNFCPKLTKDYIENL